MPRVAIIADIHGNLVALRAALADIERREVDQIVCLGDLGATGPEPALCVAEIRRLEFPTIRGNADDELLDPPDPADEEGPMRRILEISEWAASQLTAPDRDFLSNLPPTLELEYGRDRAALFVHGSPRSFDETIYATTGAEDLDAMIAGIDADILICAHTHLQMLRRHRDMLIVNPGAVGLTYHPVPPADEIRNVAWAEYGILDVEDSGLAVEFHRVPYDIEELRNSIAESDMPHREWWSSLWRAAP
ncbi:MAG: metallophosphoesterase family protein [Chloroflexota bacterium]